LKRALALILLVGTTVCPAQQPPRALPADPALRPDPGMDFFERGRNLYDSAQRATDAEQRTALYLRAAEIFSQYLNDFPGHDNAAPAWWYLGNSFQQTGSIDDAKRCFNTLLNRFGTGPWAAAAAYTLAADHYQNRQYALAAPLFERYADHASRPEEQPRGLYFAGNSYRLLGRDREAARAYRKVIAHPHGAAFVAQSRVALGHIAVRAKNDTEALTWFEEVATDSQSDIKIRAEAALHASLTATRLKRTEVADTYLKMVMQTDGMEDFRPDAQTALMNNQFAAGQYAAVVDSFRRSTVKAEGEKEAARLMIAARSLMRLKNPEEALTLFREIERLVPPENDLAYQASYYRLLCFYQIEGRHVPDQVDAFLELYQRSRPDDMRIHTALMMKAEALYANGELAEAARVYTSIDSSRVSEANRPGLLYQRGWCLAEAGDPAGALRSLNEFIQNFPKDPRFSSALAKRAKSHADTGDTTRAKADFDRVIAESSEAELISFAWLEAARMYRASSDIPDMISRYRGFLENVPSPPENLIAEANYWIGWGMVRTGSANDAVKHLDKARELRPDAYAKHAGLLLALGHFSAQNAEALAKEIDLAIQGKYAEDLPDQTIQWAGMQMFNDRHYVASARFLNLIANTDEPRQTPKEVWRYLAKASIESGKPAEALPAISHVLDVEDNSAWIADGLLDRARAEFALERFADARKSAEQAIALNPQGRTSAMLRILMGDLDMQAANPQRAAAEYLVVVQFHEDAELKPRALDKLIKALEAHGDNAEAAKFREQLQREFPNWKAP
jgi:tetratricopeptide (TPR) repeat protein